MSWLTEYEFELVGAIWSVEMVAWLFDHNHDQVHRWQWLNFIRRCEHCSNAIDAVICQSMNLVIVRFCSIVRLLIEYLVDREIQWWIWEWPIVELFDWSLIHYHMTQPIIACGSTASVKLSAPDEFDALQVWSTVLGNQVCTLSGSTLVIDCTWSVETGRWSIRAVVVSWFGWTMNNCKIAKLELWSSPSSQSTGKGCLMLSILLSDYCLAMIGFHQSISVWSMVRLHVWLFADKNGQVLKHRCLNSSRRNIVTANAAGGGTAVKETWWLWCHSIVDCQALREEISWTCSTQLTDRYWARWTVVSALIRCLSWLISWRYRWLIDYVWLNDGLSDHQHDQVPQGLWFSFTRQHYHCVEGTDAESLCTKDLGHSGDVIRLKDCWGDVGHDHTIDSTDRLRNWLHDWIHRQLWLKQHTCKHLVDRSVDWRLAGCFLSGMTVCLFACSSIRKLTSCSLHVARFHSTNMFEHGRLVQLNRRIVDWMFGWSTMHCWISRLYDWRCWILTM